MYLVKSNYYNKWSIINAAFWLVELPLGNMLKPTSSEKRRLWKPKQWRLNRVLLAKVVLSRYFLPTSWILLKPSASWAIGYLLNILIWSWGRVMGRMQEGVKHRIRVRIGQKSKENRRDRPFPRLHAHPPVAHAPPYSAPEIHCSVFTQ